MAHPPKRYIRYRKSVVVALVVTLILSHNFVVISWVVQAITSVSSPSTVSTRTTFADYSPECYRHHHHHQYHHQYRMMSVSRSQLPLFHFHRTHFGAKNVMKSVITPMIRRHVRLSHDTIFSGNRVSTELPFGKMIQGRRKPHHFSAFVSNVRPANNALCQSRRDLKLWLSTTDIDQWSNVTNSNGADGADTETTKKEQNSTTTTTTTSQGQSQAQGEGIIATESDDEGERSEKTLTSVWNVPGLKDETYRRLHRAMKRVDQLTSRIERYKAQPNKPRVNSNPHLDLHIVEAELVHASAQLREIRRFELLLMTQLHSKGRLEMVLPEQLAERALALNMTDHPPHRPPRGEPKAKGPRQMPKIRKPYRKYISIDNIEIRVGKKAEDNDELSTNPQYRDNDDWWMHAAGCPGSHVIIRYSEKKEEPPKTTLQEAAMLAAKHSKCHGNIISVNLCRARDIKKPPMSKPGMVMIMGNVRTIKVDMKASEKRLQQLESSVEVN
jgi:hypothetical protein